MLPLLLVALLSACNGGADACIGAKDAARTAWGEVGVRYSLALATAQDAVKEPQSRLAALERRPDAPAEGKAALAAEVERKTAEAEALKPKAELAQQVATAFASQKAAEAQAFATSMAVKLEGDDVALALSRADEAARACAGVE